MKKFEDVSKRLVNQLISGEMDGWPPVCCGIFHQPERPQKMGTESIQEEKSS